MNDVRPFIYQDLRNLKELLRQKLMMEPITSIEDEFKTTAVVITFFR